MSRKPRADGLRSRRLILDRAARLASIYGLEGLSIARIASDVGMSKGGITAHFPNKLALQLATVEAAQEIFAREVLEPAAQAEPGLAWVLAVVDAGLDYYRRRVFPGGCFFAAAMAEYCGREEGPVKERIAEIDRGWVGAIAGQLATAQQAGAIDAGEDPTQLAFEINAMLATANFGYALHGDATALDRGGRAIQARLHEAAPRR